MIDLRSDTLTKPSKEMRIAMLEAEVGDDGRTNDEGKGEDPTVNTLEDLAATITGKESALFCNSGTMGNIVALLTHAKRGDKVLIGENNHINKSEKSPFMEDIFGLKPEFYKTDEYEIPIMDSVHSSLDEKSIQLLCLENSNNFRGGACMSVSQTKDITEVAHQYNVPVHLDGARIFNVAAHYNIPVKHLVASVDSVMFCISKGLGAPIGSLLCGTKKFIKRARIVRKLLGGGMRQAGIVAAAGIISLENGVEPLKRDNELAHSLANKIANNTKVKLNPVQTNIVTVDVSSTGHSAKKFELELVQYGLKVKSMSDQYVRMTIYNDIGEKEIEKAANIFSEYCNILQRK